MDKQSIPQEILTASKNFSKAMEEAGSTILYETGIMLSDSRFGINVSQAVGKVLMTCGKLVHTVGTALPDLTKIAGNSLILLSKKSKLEELKDPNMVW